MLANSWVRYIPTTRICSFSLRCVFSNFHDISCKMFFSLESKFNERRMCIWFTAVSQPQDCVCPILCSQHMLQELMKKYDPSKNRDVVFNCVSKSLCNSNKTFHLKYSHMVMLRVSRISLLPSVIFRGHKLTSLDLKRSLKLSSKLGN